jgi:hypothetical protein
MKLSANLLCGRPTIAWDAPAPLLLLLYTKDPELLKLGLIFPVMDLFTIAAAFSSPSIAKSTIARLVIKSSNTSCA